MLKAIIFDMDGVLINSEPIHFETDVNVLKKFNVELSYDFYKQFIGTTLYHIWDELIKEYKLTKSRAELIEMADVEKEKILSETGFIEIPGVKNLVKNIYENGYPLAVASSSPYDYIERATSAIGVRKYFKEILSGQFFENPKPAPDIFLEAAKKLGVKPEECLVIEDSKNGVRAAKAAGMVCVGFINPDSGDQDLSSADYLVEGFEEIDTNFLEMVYCHSREEAWTVMETRNLIIREIKMDDLEEMFEIYKDESISRYTDNLLDFEKEKEFTQNYIKNQYKFYGYGLWVVIHKKSGKLIGRAGLSNRTIGNENEVEIGYLIGEKFQNKGYATEACIAIIDFAKKKLDLTKLNCFCLEENKAGTSFAEKLGFDYIGKANADNVTYSHYELIL